MIIPLTASSPNTVESKKIFVSSFLQRFKKIKNLLDVLVTMLNNIAFPDLSEGDSFLPSH